MVTVEIVTPQESINASSRGFLSPVPAPHLPVHRCAAPRAAEPGRGASPGCPASCCQLWTLFAARPEGGEARESREEVRGNWPTPLTAPRAQPEGSLRRQDYLEEFRGKKSRVWRATR